MMYAKVDEDNGSVLFYFGITHREVARELLKEAICLYQNEGCDTSALESVLVFIDQHPIHIQ